MSDPTPDQRLTAMREFVERMTPATRTAYFQHPRTGGYDEYQVWAKDADGEDSLLAVVENHDDRHAQHDALGFAAARDVYLGLIEEAEERVMSLAVCVGPSAGLFGYVEHDLDKAMQRLAPLERMIPK